VTPGRQRLNETKDKISRQGKGVGRKLLQREHIVTARALLKRTGREIVAKRGSRKKPPEITALVFEYKGKRDWAKQERHMSIVQKLGQLAAARSEEREKSFIRERAGASNNLESF